MKRTSLFYFSLAAIATGSLASCQDYEPFDEATVREAAFEREFSANFENRYGKIAPNHDWGFILQTPVNISGAATRAGSDGSASGAGFVYVNTNQWAVKPQTPNGEEYIEDFVSIPGWPNFDGYYYSNKGGENIGSILSARPTDGGTTRPCGDVTDYEVQYVSEFFRSHNKQQLKEYEQTLHLTDFFVQNVSAENDRETYPDGALKTTVLGENCNFGMDHLVFKTMESNSTIDDTWTHLNNYNRNATNLMTETPVYYSESDIQQASDYVSNRPDWMSDEEFARQQIIAQKTTSDIKVPAAIDANYKSASQPYENAVTPKRQIKYITSSGTEDFAYQSTWSTAQPFKKEWVLVKLTWDEVGQDGKSHPREGYYLAFDYEASKEGKGNYGPDGYYSNWIIKITPAYGSIVPESPRRRVMCEDLGNTLDFDFNDVVFDVYFEGTTSPYTAVITLQASGGTLPIFVGKYPSDANYEAHNMLGNNSSTPVNVGGASHEIAIYRISRETTNADEIPIYVQQQNNGATTIITLRPAAPEKGKSITPQKFEVPIHVRWMKESQQIEDGYSHFDDWVTTPNTYGENGATPWFNYPNQTTQIY